MASLSLRGRIGVLIALAFVAYLPALHLPFIADDYTQIPIARHFAAQGWTPLLSEVNLRTRATYMFLSAALDGAFGFDPFPFYATSLLLHILCVLLVYASGAWSAVGEGLSFWSAAFFAVQEGHQEAVMWPAASADLLVFLFGMGAWVCWVKWLECGGWKWYASSIGAFLLAVCSKESFWVFAVFMLLPAFFNRSRWRRGIAGALPFLAIAAIYIVWAWSSRVAGPEYHDVRFSLSAPWLKILLNSWWKLLFPWGLTAVGILAWLRKGSDPGVVGAASLWMLLGLLPFCFLTYMLQVPSRLTYIASAGLAWLFGAAAFRLYEKRRYTLLAILCAATLVINLEILWVKKMSQFRERAEPSELLKAAAADSNGSVTVGCYPLPDFVPEAILKSVGVSAVFTHPALRQMSDCFAVEYRDRQGQLVHESRRLGRAKHGAFY